MAKIGVVGLNCYMKLNRIIIQLQKTDKKLSGSAQIATNSKDDCDPKLCQQKKKLYHDIFFKYINK